MAPNYQAGKDSLAGFKRYYKGEVADEIYTQLGQLDFSAELAKIAAAKPDAVFTFMPGGMGVNLVKQYRQAGLAETTPFLSAFTVDETTLPATGEAALGFYSGAAWAPATLAAPEAATPPAASSATSPPAAPAQAPNRALRFFNAQEARAMDAIAARLIPADELGPGAKEAGVTQFIDGQLAGAWALGSS